VYELVDLLQTRPDSAQTLGRAKALVRSLAAGMEASHDGEGDAADDDRDTSEIPDEVFEQFTVALEQQGVVAAGERGAAGFDRAYGRVWDGIQMVARQQSYWKMKHRAAVVGQQGLGPLIGRLLEQHPHLGVHLVGHSFGARLVSYSLRGLDPSVGGRPPVRGVTLLQGAFSHFAFARTLPFDVTRSGALSGEQAKVSGKVVACYSRHDDAVGMMYPLASFIRRQDASDITDPTFRWGGIGHDGHQAGVEEVELRSPGTRYGFDGGGLVNIDCSDVVKKGKPPSGAHSDIGHAELAWVVMSAGGLLDPAVRPAAEHPVEDRLGGKQSATQVPASDEPDEERRLLRNAVIADALLDDAELKRLMGLGEEDVVPPDARLPVVIELSVQFEGGLVDAHKRLGELWSLRTIDGNPPHPVSDTYVPCRLTLEQIKDLVGLDQDTNEPRRRAIYRVWPDFQISPLIDGSVSTVKADAAERAYAASGRGIVWAVVDSGIDAEHPHFAGLDLRGTDVGSLHRDFTKDDPADNEGALVDDFGHGTHVAGIIAGSLAEEDRWEKTDNEPSTPRRDRLKVYQNVQDPHHPKFGTTNDRTVDARTTLRGMAPEAQLVSLKVLGGSGTGSSMNVVRALEYIRREVNGQSKLIRVHGVNLSVGYEFDAQWFACGQSPLCVEVDRLVRSGVVVVVAAGNTGYGTLGSLSGRTNVGITMTINDPGNAALAITVGATHRDMPHTYGVSYFSSKGPTGDGRQKPDLVAPGERITSAAAGRQLQKLGLKRGEPVYVEDSGTSMAAPHVSGAIASFLSIRKEFVGRPEEVKQLFVESATSLGRDTHFQGTGLVDLMRAIQSV
jgi:subtilisin family serine protease